MTRRELLKSLGGGLLVAVAAPIGLAQGGASGRQGGGAQTPQTIAAWLHIGPDGKITVYSGKVEVGQNARTNIGQAAAEELRVPFEAITVVLGDTDLCPFDQGTFGSRTTPAMLPQIRQAAASAREALETLAAKEWEVDASKVIAMDGKVVWIEGDSNSSVEKSITYGELAERLLASQPVNRDVSLTPTSDWKLMGTNAPKADGIEIVTGARKYSIDMRRPGMLHAKVLRPPSLGAELTSVDDSIAVAMPGVRVVRDGSFVAVAARTLRLAERAIASIKAEWSEKPQPSNAQLWDILKGESSQWIPDAESKANEDEPWLVQEPPEWSLNADHRPPASLTLDMTPRVHVDSDTGGISLKSSYRCPYIAHFPLEPRAALAEFDGTKMTVHTGTQRPWGVKGEVVQATGLREDQVRVIVPDTGSGYGGKHSGDAAVEAARIAKTLKAPVHLAWTREEEFMFAYFRPAGVVEIEAEADAQGQLTSWSHINYNSGGAGIRTPYRVPSPNTRNQSANTPLRQGSYRALAATFNNFARESAMDDLAYAAKVDPLEFRLRNLDDPRMIAVLKAGAERFGWSKATPGEGRGFGLACGTEKGGYVANFVELSADPQTGQIRLHRIVTAFECGAIVNPVHCENQVLGSVLQGLGGALYEAIEFANGKILNGRLSQYRVPRFSDVPSVETVMVDRKDLPSAGAGEAAIVAIAPAIANAIFHTIRYRAFELPLRIPAKLNRPSPWTV